MRKYQILFLFLVITVLCACSSDKLSLDLSSPKNLMISASISTSAIYTRSAIEGTSFAKGDVIGVFLQNDEGLPYGENVLNVPVTLSDDTWTFNPISLTADEATLYGYYPYSAENKDMVIEADIASQTDYLYATPVVRINNKNENANLVFNHALTRITFKIKKKEASVYDLLLKNVSISNVEGGISIAKAANISITDGKVSPVVKSDAFLAIASNQPITESSTVNVDMLLFPFDTSVTGNVIVTFSINDVKYEVELSNQSFLAGNRYVYPVMTSVTGTNPDDDPGEDNPVSLSIGSVSITDWNEIDMSEIGDFNNVTTAETLVAADLGTGVKWASRNMGAYTSTGYGSFYAWGESSPKSSYTMDNYAYQTLGTYKPLIENISGTIYDVAHKAWGDGWRIPTKDEWQALIDNCSWTWSSVDGVYGMKATGNGTSIFLPASGYATDKLNNSNSYGYYMTSTKYNDSQEYYVTFNSGSSKPTISTSSLITRYMGISIRAVK